MIYVTGLDCHHAACKMPTINKSMIYELHLDTSQRFNQSRVNMGEHA